MKFLLIQLRQIGDVVLTTPMPRLLKQAHPGAQIDFLTFTASAPILRHNPHITNIIAFRKADGLKAFLKLLLDIRKKCYDAVLDFQDTPRSTYCVMASGAPIKVIWQTSSRRLFYNTHVPRLGQYPSCIKANLLRPFLSDFNIDDRMPPRPEIHVSDAEENRIDRLFADYHLNADDFIVTLAPTHRREVRRWPLANFMDTAQYLIANYHAKIILTWGPGEEGYLAPVFEAGKEKSSHRIAGVFLNLLELAALMRRAKLHIGNDSAPCHIAVSQNLPTFTIYGATTSGWSYPSPRHGWVRKELDCQPCRKNVCRVDESIPCLSTLSFADIQPKLDAFIEKVVLDRK